jgi:sugar phosphate isomerase/epimerase
MLAPEFPHDSLEANLDAIAATGAESVQFDLVCAVGEAFPEAIDAKLADRVRAAFAARGLAMAALSGTCNMIHPDPVRRAEGLRGLTRLIAAAPALGASVVTLCTGSRDPDNMWRRHPDNDAPEAWADLVAGMREAVQVAEEYGMTLGVEPEIANTIDSAEKARRLMDEIASPNLKVIMDGANIFHHGELARMREMLDEAFALVGKDIVLAHAKDLDHDGEAGHVPAGRGLLDYPYYLRLLQRSGYDGAIILHALKPAEARDCLAFVRQAAPPGYIKTRRA